MIHISVRFIFLNIERYSSSLFLDKIPCWKRKLIDELMRRMNGDFLQRWSIRNIWLMNVFIWNQVRLKRDMLKGSDGILVTIIRPVVILGPLADIARDQLLDQYSDQFELPGLIFIFSMQLSFFSLQKFIFNLLENPSQISLNYKVSKTSLKK